MNCVLPFVSCHVLGGGSERSVGNVYFYGESRGIFGVKVNGKEAFAVACPYDDNAICYVSKCNCNCWKRSSLFAFPFPLFSEVGGKYMDREKCREIAVPAPVFMFSWGHRCHGFQLPTTKFSFGFALFRRLVAATF